MDSIVDAFFPLIGHIDEEVDEIDSLVIDPSVMPVKIDRSRPALAEANLRATLAEQDGIELSDRSSEQKMWEEKTATKKHVLPLSRVAQQTKAEYKTRWTVLRTRFRLWKRQLRYEPLLQLPSQGLHAAAVFLGLNHFHRHNPNRDAAFSPVFDRSSMLRRMTELRRLTTGLTRLLGSKYQVVTKLKKRAAEDNGEVGAYIGDVQGERVPVDFA
jgi:magnesium transporter